ncbi:zinc finger protein 93-like isoform X2 [Anopheles darlingi]|uniref:zinc finger protein 93-like isoform X2 n=1 Tax=Anopheles darlingi TaxID=43151 RepID=UPI0021001860|nr:zinc finger protein 93-like isoform X2 [Anopheles darlingi]
MFSAQKENSGKLENFSKQPPWQPRKPGRPRQETLKQDENKFSCPICKYELVDMISLERHQEKHEPPGGFLCSVCEAPFTTPQERNEHKSLAHPVHRCRLCRKCFYDEAQFEEHHKSEHAKPPEGTPRCSNCGTYFEKDETLRAHLKSKWCMKKNYQCDICQRYYTSEASLSVHRGLHNTTKSHVCSTCGASFYYRGQLKAHERVHNGDKPFKCDKCDKAFAHRESLVTHSSVHSGIRQYVCEHCNDRFSCKGNLIKHLKRRALTCGKREREINPVPDNAEGVPVEVDDRIDGQTEHFKVLEASGSEIEHTEHLRASEGKTEITPPREKVILLEVSLGVNAPFPGDQHEMEDTIKDDDNEQFLLDDDIPDTNVIQVENEIEVQDGEDSYVCVIVDDGNETIGNNTELHHWYTIVASGTETLVKPCLPAKEEAMKNQLSTTPNVPTAAKEALASAKPTDYKRKDWDSDSISSLEDFWCEKNVATATKKSQPKSKKKSELTSNSNLGDEASIENAQSVQQVIRKRWRPRKPAGAEITQAEIDEMTYHPEVEELEKQVQALKENYKKVSEIDYQCNLCPKQHASETTVVRHLEKMHGIEMLETMKLLQHLKKRAYPPKLYRCKYCAKIYKNWTSLIVHKELHGPDGTLLHKCCCCNTFFATKEESRQHELATHRDKLECTICQKTYLDPESLVGHTRYMHLGDKERMRSLYVCLRCGKQFSKRATLTDHERSNCGESPVYKCDECGKRYLWYSGLKSHMEVHKGQFRHECGYCTKRYPTRCQLKVHERSHTGEKPFRCEYCPKAFPYRESLMAHRAKHTGIKPFQCADCGKAFYCSSLLKVHRRRRHGSET